MTERRKQQTLHSTTPSTFRASLFWLQLAAGKYTVRGPLAQLAEQRTFNPWVVGSSPTGPTSRTEKTDQLMTPVDSSGTVFFIHRGLLQPYVRASILQAHQADSDSSIVVLGDQPREVLPPETRSVVRYELLDDYSDRADAFAQIFRFEGNNGFDYELLNFQRWFYVQSFSKAHSLTGPFLVLDSDAYLYQAIGAVAPHLSTPMTVVDSVGPQFTFFLTTKALADFTDFLTESFRTDSGFERLKNFVRESDDAGVPHVSDMAAFGVYAGSHNLEDLGAAERNDVIFCENIGSPQGLVLSTVGKKVTTRQGRRYFRTQDGRRVLAGGVHLQGGNKDLWPYFVDTSVKRTLAQHSPRDYADARRKARQKAFRIGLLKTSARVRTLLTRGSTKNR